MSAKYEEIMQSAQEEEIKNELSNAQLRSIMEKYPEIKEIQIHKPFIEDGVVKIISSENGKEKAEGATKLIREGKMWSVEGPREIVKITEKHQTRRSKEKMESEKRNHAKFLEALTQAAENIRKQAEQLESATGEEIKHTTAFSKELRLAAEQLERAAQRAKIINPQGGDTTYQEDLGQDLSKFAKNSDAPTSFKIAGELSAQLHALHSAGNITHNDVKAPNVMTKFNGEGEIEVQLIDFDLSSSTSENRIRRNIGTIDVSPSLYLTSFTMGSGSRMTGDAQKAISADARGYIDTLRAYCDTQLLAIKETNGSTNKESNEKKKRIKSENAALTRAGNVMNLIFDKDYAVKYASFKQRVAIAVQNFMRTGDQKNTVDTEIEKIKSELSSLMKTTIKRGKYTVTRAENGLLNLHQLGLSDINNVNRLIALARLFPVNLHDPRKSREDLLTAYKILYETDTLEKIPSDLSRDTEEPFLKEVALLKIIMHKFPSDTYEKKEYLYKYLVKLEPSDFEKVKKDPKELIKTAMKEHTKEIINEIKSCSEERQEGKEKHIDAHNKLCVHLDTIQDVHIKNINNGSVGPTHTHPTHTQLGKLLDDVKSAKVRSNFGRVKSATSTNIKNMVSERYDETGNGTRRTNR